MSRRKKDDTATLPPPDGTTVTVSRETLDKTPEKLLRFLGGIGTRPPIFQRLATRGYTQAEHVRGWGLLKDCAGYQATNELPAFQTDALEATAQLDESDEPTFGVLQATLTHRAPQALIPILGGLVPGTGADSVLFHTTLVGRLRMLEAGTLPGLSKEDSAKVDKLIAERGIDEAARARMAALVDRAQAAGVLAPRSPGMDREKLDEALRAARAFYEEWSEIARTLIVRRDHLILLGLASRRSKRPDPAPAAQVNPPAAVPAPAAPANGAIAPRAGEVAAPVAPVPR